MTWLAAQSENIRMGPLTFSLNITLDGCAPWIAGHGPALYQSSPPGTRRLELVSSTPLRKGEVAMCYQRAHG